MEFCEWTEVDLKGRYTVTKLHGQLLCPDTNAHGYEDMYHDNLTSRKEAKKIRVEPRGEISGINFILKKEGSQR